MGGGDLFVVAAADRMTVANLRVRAARMYSAIEYGRSREELRLRVPAAWGTSISIFSSDFTFRS